MIEFEFSNELNQNFIVGEDIQVSVRYDYAVDKFFVDIKTDSIEYNGMRLVKDVNVFGGIPDLGVLFVSSDDGLQFNVDNVEKENSRFYFYYMDKSEALENGVSI